MAQRQRGNISRRASSTGLRRARSGLVGLVARDLPRPPKRRLLHLFQTIPIYWTRATDFWYSLTISTLRLRLAVGYTAPWKWSTHKHYLMLSVKIKLAAILTSEILSSYDSWNWASTQKLVKPRSIHRGTIRIFLFPWMKKPAENKAPVLGNAVPVLSMNLKWGEGRIFVNFQHRPMFSHINGKLSPRPFQWCGWTWANLEK